MRYYSSFVRSFLHSNYGIIEHRLRNQGTKDCLGTVRLTKKLFELDVLEFIGLTVMADLSTLQYPILTDKNWSRWSTQMRVVFRVQKVSSVIEGELTADSSGKEEQKKEFKEKEEIKPSAREAWNILIRCHSIGEKFKKVRLQTLRRQYEHMEMEDSDKVVANQMKSCKETISDVMIMEKIMRSMPAAFDHIVVAIEESRDIEKLKIEELQSAFEACEMRRNRRKQRDDQALKTQHVPGERKGKSNKWKGKDDQEEKNNSADKKVVTKKQYTKKEKKNMECFVGYIIEEESDSEPVILMVATNAEGHESAKNTWYVDSGCSNHMTYNRSWMSNLDESKKSKIRVVDNNTLKVEEIGNIKIRRKDGLHATLENVLLVPEMKCNLLSVGQLTKNGYTVIMGSNAHMKVNDQGKNLILKCTRSINRTFQVCLEVVEALQCLTSVNEDESWRWHLRLGHLNYRDLQLLSNKKLVSGLVISQPQKGCESCLIGKQTRRSFHSQLEIRSKERPVEPPIIVGNKYFVSFVDEFSRMTWVYFIRQKSEVLEIFKGFKKHTEKEIEKQIKLLRTNGGGEYTSRDFEVFCQDNGITHEVTTAYTLEHNGLAKRRNRTIMNMTRCMLKEKGVARELWGEVVATAVYVLNRCPTKRLPRSNHMQPGQGEAMVFVGYHPTGAYKLFDPNRKKITISRGVIILEDES
ncbi:hypothetical protein V8G54_000456 [Vigna mungo]|uniref:Integrase catalytic domain-containing protein n=1 Tax=Vigna mungo TaxID=3915 RepID=A0AAQ3P6Y1_VIGMU